MIVYKKQILSAVSIISASLFLTGCSLNDEVSQSVATDSENQTSVQPTATTTPIADVNEMLFAKEIFNNKDAKKAFLIFEKYAAQGDAEAEAWLGRCYMNGIGTERNREKSYEFFSKAEKKNNPWGINGLAECYQYGIGTAVNLRAAIELFQKAADMNHPLGTLNLARLYSDRNNGFFNAKSADTYFKKALELEAPSAKSAYAMFLCSEKRYTEAIPLLAQSLDESDSMWQMSMCYQNGWGVPVDISKAVDLAEKHYHKFGPRQWSANTCLYAGFEERAINGMTEKYFHRIICAAAQGNAEAQYYRALNLLDVGNKRDALNYLIKSADNGYAVAMLKAGIVLMELKDYENAIKYLTLASTKPRTQKGAIENLSNLYYRLKMPKTGAFWDIKGMALGSDLCRNKVALVELFTEGNEHFAKAAALFAEGRFNKNEFAKAKLSEILEQRYEQLRQLADNNNSDALLALGIVGCIEEKGHPNIPIGIELLEKSAKLNNATACRMLGNIYINGVVVPKDLKKAFDWYVKGMELGDAYSAGMSTWLITSEESIRNNLKIEDINKIFEKAVQSEDMSIYYWYGLIKENIEKKQEEAKNLYQHAARLNNTSAMIRMYEILQKNNQNEALNYLKQAVALQDSWAELTMSDYYVSQNLPRTAFSYLLRAYIHGDNFDAPCRLAHCWLNGYGCEINHKCFWKFVDIAYKNRNPDACYLLGSVFYEGKICSKDHARAKLFLEEGAKLGSEDCKKALKEAF